ncbi:Yip1 family protein [Streptomyces sp. NPDC048514]|uniref:Yip1 family protein n=1 Tax=Streptomyces sp. NPDC048514 TaxID=3365564 RepID=UPI0037167456
MSMRPWVTVEAPDGRGLRAVTVGGRTVGSAWSLRELRKMLNRLGHPDVDVQDPASVYWRGGDSATWPDRAWRRRVTVVLMTAGLLASAALNAVIGWPDASGALTFAQRMTGALFVLSGAVQLGAAVLVPDHWGRRQLQVSGAVVLLGVLIAVATDTLLLVMWLDETQYTPYMLAFMPLWCWSLWALYLLIREKSWKAVPTPRRFAAGVFVSALLTTVSLAYSTLYQPAVAPMRFALKAGFGTARADRGLPFVHVPLKLSVKNTGEVPVYVIINDFTVYGRTAKYSEQGDSLRQLREWEESIDRRDEEDEEAERYVDHLEAVPISSGRFYPPGRVLGSGQEDTLVHVFQMPRNVKYDLLHVDLQITYMRKDRGWIDVEDFQDPHPSWEKGTEYYCHPSVCGEKLIFQGLLRHNNNLINVTRGPHYVRAAWYVDGPPEYSVSSRGSPAGSADPAEVKKDIERFDVSTVNASSEISVAELLKSMPSPRPS